MYVLSGRPLRFWIGLVLLVALVSFAVDQTTGDTTGPPYNDSLLNHIAFFIFLATIVVLFALVLVAVVRLVRHRSSV